MAEFEEQLITEIMNTTVDLWLNRMETGNDDQTENSNRRNIVHGDSSSSGKGKKSRKRDKNSGNKNESSGTEKKSGKKNLSAEFSALGLLPPPEIPDHFRNRIESVGGREANLVIQKFIYKSDDNDNENRLSMPLKQLMSEFTTEEEERELNCKNNKDGMKVMLIEPSLVVSNVHLTKWKLGGSKAYVFKNEWNEIRKRNGDDLKKDSVIQVWAFRVGLESKLGFAIFRVGKQFGGLGLELDMNPNIGLLQLDLNQRPEESGLDFDLNQRPEESGLDFDLNQRPEESGSKLG